MSVTITWVRVIDDKTTPNRARCQCLSRSDGRGCGRIKEALIRTTCAACKRACHLPVQQRGVPVEDPVAAEQVQRPRRRLQQRHGQFWQQRRCIVGGVHADERAASSGPGRHDEERQDVLCTLQACMAVPLSSGAVQVKSSHWVLQQPQPTGASELRANMVRVWTPAHSVQYDH